MPTAMTSPPPSRLVTVGLWVLKGPVAAVFLAAAAAKLSGQPMMVAEFGEVGLGQGFRYLVALVEIGGAVLLLAPRTAWIGAGVLVVVCVGALIAQVTRLHGDLVHVFVLGALTAFLAWVSRPPEPASGARR